MNLVKITHLLAIIVNREKDDKDSVRAVWEHFVVDVVAKGPQSRVLIHHSDECLKNIAASYNFEEKLDMTNQRVADRLFLLNIKQIIKKVLGVSLQYLE